MLIFLIGYMGSGKTTLGKGVARKLLFEFCDMDKLIEQREGATIATIFETKGEEYFRKLEKECLNSFCSSQNLVVATGGGAPCFYDNIDVMNKIGTTVYLKIKPGILSSRLKGAKNQRPIIASKSNEELLEFITGALVDREPFYEQAEHIIIGDNIKTDDIVTALRG